MSDFNITGKNLSPDLALPNRGTAPYNEMEAFHKDDHGQRHNNESVDDDNAPSPEQLEAAVKGSYTPQDFKWGTDAKGKPLLKPTTQAVIALFKLATTYFNDSEERNFGLKHNPEMAKNVANFTKSIKNNRAAIYISQVAEQLHEHHETIKFTKQLASIKRNIDNIDNRVGDSIIRAIGKDAEQQFCTGTYWLEMHRNTHWELTEKGNETAAENALIRAEESRAQLLIAAQLLDYCVAEGFKIDLMRGARSAMNLRGWSQTRRILDDQATAQQRVQDHKTMRQSQKRSINF